MDTLRVLTEVNPHGNYNHGDATSMTNQSDKDGTDLNILVGRMTAAELRDLPPIDPAFYGDLGEVATMDLQDVMDRVKDANDKFMALPSKIREHFDNNPGKLNKFLNDPNNLDKAVDLGILRRVQEQTTQQEEPDAGTREAGLRRTDQETRAATRAPGGSSQADRGPPSGPQGDTA